MRQLLFILVATYAFVALSSAGRSRTKIWGVSSVRKFGDPVSNYFYTLLNGYFPNERRQASLVGVGNALQLLSSGPPGAPVEVAVPITLQNQVTRTKADCLAVVHLGNAVTGNLDHIYFGEEADIRNPLAPAYPCPQY